MTDGTTRRPADPFTERTPRVVVASKLDRAAARRKQGRFLAEGPNAVEAALVTDSALELFVTEEAMERFRSLVGSAARRGVPVSAVTEKAARSLSDTVSSTGLVALCRSVAVRSEASAETDDAGRDAGAGPGHRLVAIGQALSDPGNVGTLVRVADALGADAVWLTEGSADPENPKAVRASAGSLFHLPVVTGLAEAALPALAHEAGLRLVVATGDGDTDLEHADALLSQPAAWVFGNEAHGVPESLAAAADARVRIPLRGRAESLNIVTAASICLHTSSRLLAASGTGDAVRATPSA